MRIAAVAALLLAPVAAHAQASQCSIPEKIERPHPDLPSAHEPRRILPIGGYTLAVTWSPQYCVEHAREPSAKFECGAGNRFGFTLHGLWPDGVGKEWPQYCRATKLLPAGFLAGRLCTTPSVQLLQHEWAKHGTCTGMSPNEYFERSTRLYARLRYPDMDALSRRRGLTIAAFKQAIAKANPGLTSDMVRVTANRRGWLDELWLCLDRRLAYASCRAGTGSLPDRAALKIWRGKKEI